MKYRKFIEENFLIDEPKAGKLVPFIFNDVQVKYYNELCELGLEEKGIALALREFIVKARREGFSSLILGLFAADDILQTNPTESQVISYKDDATETFRKRYRRYVLSWYAREMLGISVEEIQANPTLLDQHAKEALSADASDMVLKHNQAHFYCGTASARTGGRGGVLQKLLFSEAAHYPDTENMTAAEIIEGTTRQVDVASGWIFQESTANGKGNLFYRTWELIQKGLSRYVPRFYGWREFYTEEQFKIISSEFVDADMLRQEYPETAEEAFLSSNLAYTTREELLGLVGANAKKGIAMHLELQGVNYIDQCEILKDFLITFEKANPHKPLYCGIDSAKDVDRTVLTILRSTEISPQGGVRCLAIDATGAGDFMPDWFERNTKWYIHRVKFSRPVKSIGYKNLRVVIQDKLTSVPVFLEGKEFATPEWEHWYNELLDLQKQIIGELLVVAHPAGNYHDDYPDSWMLAELGYMTINGVPAGHKPPDEEPSFDSTVRRMLGNRSGPPAGGNDTL